MEEIEEILQSAENALVILAKSDVRPKQNTSDLVKLFCVLMSTSNSPVITECIKNAKQIYKELNT